MFFFFLNSNRSGIITFCGTHTDIIYDPNGPDCKEGFRLYEDGYYKGGKPITSRHPNILKSVLIGKKGWGLWAQEWTNGIVDWTFTKEEILGEFEKVKIEIPEPLLKDFDNVLERKKTNRNLIYFEQLSREEKVEIVVDPKELEMLHSGGMWV